VTFDEMEAALRARLEALPPAARAVLIHVIRLPDFERADAIGTYWGHPEKRTFGGAPDRLRGGPNATGGAGWACGSPTSGSRGSTFKPSSTPAGWGPAPRQHPLTAL